MERRNTQREDLLDEESRCSTQTSAAGEDAAEEQQQQIARQETRVVVFLRLLVFFVLILATTLGSVFVYRYTKNNEQDKFEAQFLDQSRKVLEAFQQNVVKKLAATSSMSTVFTSYALASNSTMPFVTLPNFERRVVDAVIVADALFMTYLPIITDDTRQTWEQYSVAHHQWITESIAYQEELKALNRTMGLNHSVNEDRHDNEDRSLQQQQQQQQQISITELGFSTKIYTFGPNGVVPDTSGEPYLPVWQNAPYTDSGSGNVNIIHYYGIRESLVEARKGKAVIGKSIDLKLQITDEWRKLIHFWYGDVDLFNGDSVGYVLYPVFSSLGQGATVEATLIMFIFWRSLFANILPPNADGVVAVFENTCNQSFTYQINGPEVQYIGAGDLHNRRYEYLAQSATVTDYIANRGSRSYTGVPLTDAQDHCDYSVRVYPSREFEDEYVTSNPIIFTVGVVVIFVFTSLVFVLYDRFVERRQRLVLKKALQTDSIVSSVFPAVIRQRLIEADEAEKAAKANKKRRGKGRSGYMSSNVRLKSFLTDSNIGDGEEMMKLMEAKPIADLCPDTSVFFADICGFTAWSSARDPAQVFTLLQTVYHSFDAVAKRFKVFKVETVGDSYTAVTGLPEPQKDHAIRIIRFARECVIQMNEVTKRLEVSLGPDTGDLAIRIGIHSGPVVAGVLRGDKTRFQLFGHTVNTASRLEKTSTRNQIQVSQSTAELLMDAGKEHWLQPRDDVVEALAIRSFWITPQVKLQSELSQPEPQVYQTPPDELVEHEKAEKQQRLIEWHVEGLLCHLKKIIARRNAMRVKHSSENGRDLVILGRSKEGITVLDEFQDVIALPTFDPMVASREQDPETVEISSEVVAQLRDYVTNIASLYRDNPFHNFEHASHVTMAVDKFLKRVVAPDLDIEKNDRKSIASNLHDYTHGITSDPLTHFSIVLSAMIHDCDHQGISNAQLIKENSDLATLYKNKSMAEQNSVDLAWALLMQPKYRQLRACIYSNMAELKRFRQLITNVVLSTDIMDKELNALRKNRWQKAFSDTPETKVGEDTNVRATIVIEHIIQASDVVHTMQHWCVYRKWNQRLFDELMLAYKAGRMEKDPSTFWYQGELGFLDNYVIPLAKKLKAANVFGVSSDECLNYAVLNRREWEVKGKGIVDEMMEKYREQ